MTVVGDMQVKNKAILTATCVAAGLAAVVTANVRIASALDKFDKALESAQGLDVKFSVRELGGAASEYQISLAKPDKARIITPEKTIVADGKQITVYLPKEKMFYKKAQNQAALLAAFDEQGLSVWSGFFDSKASSRHAGAQDAGTVQLGGVDYSVVKLSADKRGETTATYYIDKRDNLAKKVDFESKVQGKTLSTLLNASSISLNTKDTFAFNAPDGTKEISEDDLTAGHWLSDWDQAMSLAKATHKIVMVDFMASWCGPCKALDKQSFHTEAFKQETKNIILVKIDIDQQPALAQKYGVEAIPNVQFIDEKGVVVHKFLGLIPDSEVIQNIRTAKSKRP